MNELVSPLKRKACVILIEDQKPFRRYLKLAMESDGLAVFDVKTAQDGLRLAARKNIDLVVIDMNLPTDDGVSFMRKLREWCEIPAIVLSTHSDETDTVRILDAGADDYLTKPFGMGELLARVRALLRSQTQRAVKAGKEIAFGDVRVDLIQHIVTRAGILVQLTPIEYRLLRLLILNEGKLLTHQQMLKEIWGADQIKKSHYLRIYISGIRRKLESYESHSSHIVTEPGVGYRFIF